MTGILLKGGLSVSVFIKCENWDMDLLQFSTAKKDESGVEWINKVMFTDTFLLKQWGSGVNMYQTAAEGFKDNYRHSRNSGYFLVVHLPGSVSTDLTL